MSPCPAKKLSLINVQFKTWIFDGAADGQLSETRKLLESLMNQLVHGAFALSGEPMASQISATYGKLSDQYRAAQIAEVNVGIRKWRKEYMDYWNSTSALTRTGRPVEAVITPLAPFPAARPDMYKYYGTFIFRHELVIKLNRVKSVLGLD